MLAPIEFAARRIWEVRPNRSSLGNVAWIDDDLGEVLSCRPDLKPPKVSHELIPEADSGICLEVPTGVVSEKRDNNPLLSTIDHRPSTTGHRL